MTFGRMSVPTYICVGVLWQDAENVTVKRSVVLIKGGLTPATRMESPLRAVNEVKQGTMGTI